MDEKELLRIVKRIEKKVDRLSDGGRMRRALWNMSQVREDLGVSRNTVMSLIKELGGRKVGDQWRFKPELVELYFKNSDEGQMAEDEVLWRAT